MMLLHDPSRKRIPEFYHVETAEENKYIKGKKNGDPGIVVYNGIKGTVRYWAAVVGVSPQSIGYRLRMYSEGSVTLDQVMSKKMQAPARKEVKKPVMKYAPSGIPAEPAPLI